ncbi:MAG: hypothetical protein Q9219_004318 [cf. Caloplaca sp. 3 TL-2023]
MVAKARGISLSFAESWSRTRSSTSINHRLNIRSRIRPDLHPEISVVVEEEVGRAPRGVRLIASVATRITKIWKEQSNSRIRQTIVDRAPPYSDFLFVTQPNTVPGAELTTEKVGIAYAKILTWIKFPPYWPGVITAKIWDSTPTDEYALEAGTLTIMNFGLAAISSNASSPGGDPEREPLGDRPSITLPNNQTSLQFSTPIHRWLSCWLSVYELAIEYSTGEHVTDVLAHRRPSSWVPIKCWPLTWGDTVEVTLFTPAAERWLTWQVLIDGMMEWIKFIAGREDQYFAPWQIWHANAKLAVLQVALSHGNEANNHTATA